MKVYKAILLFVLFLICALLSAKSTYAAPLDAVIVFSSATPNPVTAGEVLTIRGQGFGDEYVPRSSVQPDQNEGSTIDFYVGSQVPEPAYWFKDNSSVILWSDTEIQILLAETAATIPYEVTGEITNFSNNIANFPGKKLTTRFTFTVRPIPPTPPLLTVRFAVTCGNEREPYSGAYVVLEDSRGSTFHNVARVLADANGRGTASFIIEPLGSYFPQQFYLVAGRVPNIPEAQPPKHLIDLDNAGPWEISSLDFDYPQCPQLQADNITIYNVNGDFVPGGSVEVFALASAGETTIWDPQGVREEVGIQSVGAQPIGGNFFNPIYAQEEGVRVLDNHCSSVCQVVLPNDLASGEYELVVILKREGSGEIIDSDTRRISIENQPISTSVEEQGQENQPAENNPFIPDFIEDFFGGPKTEEEVQPVDQEQPQPKEVSTAPEEPATSQEGGQEQSRDILCGKGIDFVLPDCPQQQQEPQPQEETQEQPPEESGFGQILKEEKQVDRIVIGDKTIYASNLADILYHLDGTERQAQDFEVPVTIFYTGEHEPSSTTLFFHYQPDVAALCQNENDFRVEAGCDPQCNYKLWRCPDLPDDPDLPNPRPFYDPESECACQE